MFLKVKVSDSMMDVFESKNKILHSLLLLCGQKNVMSHLKSNTRHKHSPHYCSVSGSCRHLCLLCSIPPNN